MCLLFRKRVIRRFIQQWFPSVRSVRADSIPKNVSEIRLFTRVRNEALRLPFFFEYYRSLGVDRFFVIDHNSTDDTQSIVMNQPNTHVFTTTDSYKNANHGTDWIQYLLNRYGHGCWCLVVDADELLDLPTSVDSLQSLVNILESEEANCLRVLLLDLYGKEPLKHALYKTGQDPRTLLQYFDADPSFYSIHGRLRSCHGGMRKRVFGVNVNLTKYPLFHFHRGMNICVGMHSPISGSTVARERSVLLHTKFTSDLLQTVSREVQRGERWSNSAEYRTYQSTLNAEQGLQLYHPQSVLYQNVEQITQLGLLYQDSSSESQSL